MRSTAKVAMENCLDLRGMFFCFYQDNFLKSFLFSYGYGGGSGTLSMFNGTQGSPTSNVPATAQAYVAPKSAPVAPNGNGQPKFGSRDICPRCNKGLSYCCCQMWMLISCCFSHSCVHCRKDECCWPRKIYFFDCFNAASYNCYNFLFPHIFSGLA